MKKGNTPIRTGKRKGRVVLTCQVCHKLFEIKRAAYLRGQGKTCSVECKRQWLSMRFLGKPRPDLRDRATLRCEICGAEFEVSKSRSKIAKFCSRRCMGIAFKRSMTLACEYCGRSFERRPFAVEESKHHFCSIECFYKYQKSDNHPNWRGGTSSLPHAITYTEELKERIRERDGRICQYCAIEESKTGVKLSVHHINYERLDDREDNLICLCKWCHIKTHSHRNFYEAYFKMKIQEKSSIQSRLHLIQER